jgi:hypothetical protein
MDRRLDGLAVEADPFALGEQLQDGPGRPGNRGTVSPVVDGLGAPPGQLGEFLAGEVQDLEGCAEFFPVHQSTWKAAARLAGLCGSPVRSMGARGASISPLLWWVQAHAGGLVQSMRSA